MQFNEIGHCGFRSLLSGKSRAVRLARTVPQAVFSRFPARQFRKARKPADELVNQIGRRSVEVRPPVGNRDQNCRALLPGRPGWAKSTAA
jgi:hypothetical protein